MKFLNFTFGLTVLLGWSSLIMGQTTSEEPRLLGECQRAELEEAPYDQWFNSFYDEYEPTQEVIENLKSSPLANYRIQIFFGSWCGDSKREVPRFLKILDKLNFPENKLELIAVDKGEAYKQSPGGEESGKSIFRVPVFIILNGDKELGRIVEYPVSSLERDLLSIVQEQAYTPNYYSYPFITQWEKEGILSDKNIDSRGLVNQIRGKVSTSSELNAAGYVFLKSKKAAEAIRVFTLNVYLFPEEGNTYDSLAEGFIEADNNEAAIWAYEKVLSLEPENERVKKIVEDMKALAKEGNISK